MAKKYKVIVPVGKLRKGQIVDDSDPYVRRKLREGGCLEEYKDKGAAPENKAVKAAPENKGGDK